MCNALVATRPPRTSANKDQWLRELAVEMGMRGRPKKRKTLHCVTVPRLTRTERWGTPGSVGSTTPVAPAPLPPRDAESRPASTGPGRVGVAAGRDRDRLLLPRGTLDKDRLLSEVFTASRTALPASSWL